PRRHVDKDDVLRVRGQAGPARKRRRPAFPDRFENRASHVAATERAGTKPSGPFILRLPHAAARRYASHLVGVLARPALPQRDGLPGSSLLLDIGFWSAGQNDKNSTTRRTRLGSGRVCQGALNERNNGRVVAKAGIEPATHGFSVRSVVVRKSP